MPIDSHNPIVEADAVSFVYGDKLAIEDISLTIYRGEYLGIVGPNGSGKTTLLLTLLGLLQPSHGSVRLFGEEISQFRDWHRIGYVPQKATNIDARFPATVREIVEMGRYGRRGLFRRLGEADRRQVQSALDRVHMADLQDRLIGSLSGGQQQRVFIARALAGEPDVLFLDEPTTGIDEKAEESFYALLRTLNHDLHMTIVIVSHDLGRIAREADHIACINRTLTCHASPETFLKESDALTFIEEEGKVPMEIISHRHTAS